jgi:hypothetical protein
MERVAQSAVFRSPWKMGLALFSLNGGLFFGTLTALLGSAEWTIMFRFPSPIVLIVPLAIAVSLLSWLWFGNTWQGNGKGRGIAALLGSSFYLVLFAYSIYNLTTLRPAFPGDDPFMKAIGLTLLLIVSATAGVTSLLTVGWPRRRNTES